MNDELKVILLDLRLPKVDGLEVLRRIRADERTRMIPVVVLTSSQEDRDVMPTATSSGDQQLHQQAGQLQRVFSATVEKLGLYWLLVNRQCRAA